MKACQQGFHLPYEPTSESLQVRNENSPQVRHFGSEIAGNSLTWQLLHLEDLFRELLLDDLKIVIYGVDAAVQLRNGLFR